MWKVIVTWANFKTFHSRTSGALLGERKADTVREKTFDRFIDAANYQRNCERLNDCVDVKMIKSD